MKITRREFLQSAGALVISYNFPAFIPTASAASAPIPNLNGWLSIGQDGRVTVFCGKVELGTGVLTSLTQMVADELDVALGQVHMIMGDTALVPNQGVTAGSKTTYSGGKQLRQAAATARQVLLGHASQALNASPSLLSVINGIVFAPGGKRMSYAALVKSKPLNQPVNTAVALKSPRQFRLIGRSIQRLELPAIIYGKFGYVQNIRIAGMKHGRVIRPAMPNARLLYVDSSSVSHLPGNVRVLVKGNFVGVIADREEQAVQAARLLRVSWQPTTNMPSMASLSNWLRTAPATPTPVESVGNVNNAFHNAARIFQVSYSTPYQSHGSVGPSAAIADVKPNRATLWSPTQSSFNTRGSVAALLGLPSSSVRLVWVEGSGCYGQNGADDATADAALLSQLAGHPVRVQWTREDEFLHDPKTAAMTTTLRAAVDHNGNILAWDANIWSPNHNGRPDGKTAGMLLAGQALGLASGNASAVGADRNARHDYQIANRNIMLHLLHSSFLRVSSMRGLGAPHNTFATESFMDELAAAAGVDPIAFRLRYLVDPRAIAVIREVARISNWGPRPAHQGNRAAGTGRGMAYVHYEGTGAYVAVVINITVDSRGKVSVTSVCVAQDCGLIINPDGVRNQVEGNVLQGLSRALYEQVSFNTTQLTSSSWSSYPIMRFSDVPQIIQISLINRPQEEAVGVGEAATVPIYAALANAYYDATGIRKRSIPLFPGNGESEGWSGSADG